MQKLIAGALAAASMIGAVAVTATPTAVSAQPYGYHHPYWRHHFYRPYCGWRCHHPYWRHGPYWRHHYYR